MTERATPLPTDGASALSSSLERSAIGLPSAIVQSAAFVAPTAGIVATVAFIASYSGLASPLSFAIGTVICLAIAIVVGEYARWLPTAGSFYVYLRATFGASAGFIAGTILALSYFLIFGFQLGFFASFAQDLTADDGFSVPWQIFAVALLTLSVGLTVAGIRPSLRAGLVALIIECAILLALGLLIVFKGGASGNTLQAFNWNRSLKGQSGLWIGVVYTIFAFTGFESAATLGEEVRRPRRNIPLAIVATVCVIGIFETFMSYAAVIGYGTSKADVASLIDAPNPISSLADRYGNSTLSFLVTLAVVSSFTALNIVTVSALSRMLYSMARDGLAPKSLQRLNRSKAPGRAAIAIGVITLAYVLGFGSGYGPETFASWITYFATLFWIIAYAAVVLGLVCFVWMKHREDWSWGRHCVLPLVAFGGIVWVGYGNVHPLPPTPLRDFIWVTIAAVVGVVALAYSLKRKRPDIILRAGYLFEDGEEDHERAPETPELAAGSS